jgi:hypothetical protein
MTPKVVSEADIDAAFLGCKNWVAIRAGGDALYADPATGKFWELRPVTNTRTLGIGKGQ